MTEVQQGSQKLRLAWDLSAFDDLHSGAVKRALKLITYILRRPDHPEFVIFAQPDLQPILASYFETSSGAVTCLAVQDAARGPWQRLSPNWRRRFEALIKEQQIDWVHQDSRPITWPQKTIHTVHDLRDLDRRFRRRLAGALWLRLLAARQWQSCVRVVTVSEYTRECLGKLWPAASQASTLVANGIDAADYAAIAAARADRKMGRRRHMLIIGHLESRKNPQLIAALANELWALERSKSPKLGDWQINLVGRDAGGREALLGALGEDVASRLHWHGELDEEGLATLMIETDLVLAPALFEGFGLVPLEAIAAGIPVLVSDIEAHREVLGAQDWLLDPRQPQDWIDAILDPPSYSLAWRAELLERWSWDHAATQLAALYEDLSLP